MGNSLVEKKPSNKKKVTIILTLIIGVTVVVLVISLYLLHQSKSDFYSNIPNETKKTSNIFPSPIVNLSKTFIIQKLGIQFQLPQKIAKDITLKEESIQMASIPGDTGNILCIHLRSNTTLQLKNTSSQIQRSIGCTFSNSDIMIIGGSSSDASISGRMFLTEMQGFRFDQSTRKIYLLRNAANNIGYSVTNKLTSFIVNRFLQVLEMNGNNLPTDSIYLFGNFGKSSQAGIINTGNSSYPGISVQTSNSTIDQLTFDQILTTFRPIKRNI